MALTGKKLAFCFEYILDFDRKGAMQRIGMPETKTMSTAFVWLQDPEVKAKIQELTLEKQSQLNMSAYDVLNELKTIISSDIKDYVDEENNIIPLKNLPSSKTRAISTLIKTVRYNMWGEKEETTRITFWDKNAALEKLGKHFGVFEIDNSQKRPLIQVKIG